MNNPPILEEEKKPKVNNNNKKLITSIQTKFEFGRLSRGVNITSLIKTEDNRLAMGYSNGSISINSLNLPELKWSRDIHDLNAHTEDILALCNLSNKRLLSGGMNKIIVWTFDVNNMTKIKTISSKIGYINKIIPLNQSFVFCSWDGNVRILDDSNYNQITILNQEHSIQDILHLKQKNILVTGSVHSETGISFWNLHSFNIIASIKGHCVDLPNYMIELGDGNIALSSKKFPNPIVIISCMTFEIIKEIDLKGIVSGSSPLCLIDNYSFICTNKNKVLQISSVDYSIIFISQGKGFNNYCGIILPIEEDCFLIESCEYVSVMKINVD